MKSMSYSRRATQAPHCRIPQKEATPPSDHLTGATFDVFTRIRQLTSRLPAYAILASIPASGVELFTNQSLTTPGLTGSYVNRSLETASAPDDWRMSQAISGTRIDPSLLFTTGTRGTRGPVGLTGGSDADWENFSVQWDGWFSPLAKGSFCYLECVRQTERMAFGHFIKFWIASTSLSLRSLLCLVK